MGIPSFWNHIQSSKEHGGREDRWSFFFYAYKPHITASWLIPTFFYFMAFIFYW